MAEENSDERIVVCLLETVICPSIFRVWICKLYPDTYANMDKEQRNIVIFNASKRELFTSNSGYKSMQKKLRAQWKIQRYNLLTSCRHVYRCDSLHYWRCAHLAQNLNYELILFDLQHAKIASRMSNIINKQNTVHY